MGIAFHMPLYGCIYMLLITMVFVWGATVFLLFRKEVECDAPAVQLVLGAINSSWKCRICCHGRITLCIRIS